MTDTMPFILPGYPRRHCEECRFFVEGGKAGTCQKEPPALTPNVQFEDGTGGSQKDSSVWPVVEPDDWCGRWELCYEPGALDVVHSLLLHLGAVDEKTAVPMSVIDETIKHYVPDNVLETILHDLCTTGRADYGDVPESAREDEDVAYFALKNSDAAASMSPDAHRVLAWIQDHAPSPDKVVTFPRLVEEFTRTNAFPFAEHLLLALKELEVRHLIVAQHTAGEPTCYFSAPAITGTKRTE
jgi:hypothetical protein